MGIKTAIVLSCTGGLDYTRFTSVNVVEAYVLNLEAVIKVKLGLLNREAKKLPEMASTFLAGFSHPNSNLNRHLEVLNELFDKADMLDSIYSLLVSGFALVPKAQPLITRVHTLITYTKKRVDKALLAMSSGVEKHAPLYFARCVKSITKAVAAYSGQYESMNLLNLMRVVTSKVTGDTKGTQFSVYLCFSGITDSNGYKHEKYHVVLSCVVDKFGKFTMSLALQPTLLLPGKFRSTDVFTSPSDCLNTIKIRMAEEGFAWGTNEL